METINETDKLRQDLVERYGEDNVFNTEQLREHFEVISFLAPFVSVKRKSDGEMGTLEFVHMPRFYFNFIKENA